MNKSSSTRPLVALTDQRVAEISAALLIHLHLLEEGSFPTDMQINAHASRLAELLDRNFLMVYAVLKNVLAPRLVPGHNARRESRPGIWREVPPGMIPNIYPVIFALAHYYFVVRDGKEAGGMKLVEAIERYHMTCDVDPIAEIKISPDEFFSFISRIISEPET